MSGHQNWYVFVLQTLHATTFIFSIVAFKGLPYCICINCVYYSITGIRKRPILECRELANHQEHGIRAISKLIFADFIGNHD